MNEPVEEDEMGEVIVDYRSQVSNSIKEKGKEGYPCKMEVGKRREPPNKTRKRENTEGTKKEDGEGRTIWEPKSERFEKTPQ